METGGLCSGSKIRRYLRSKVPCIDWIRGYNLKCLQGDVIAGLTVGMMVIPQGLAYAHLAELPPNYGLYASFVGVLVYIFTGTCKDITIGPTAIMSQVVAEVAKGNTKLALTCSVFAGGLQIIMGFFFLGFLVWVISTPILCGFTTAAALSIGFGQFSKLLGIKGVRRQFWQNIYDTLKNIKKTRWPDAVLGISCIILLALLRFLQQWAEKKRNRFTVEPGGNIRRKALAINTVWFLGISRNIVVVLGALSLAYAFRNDKTFTMVGQITGGLPKPRIDQFSSMWNHDESYCDVDVEESLRWTCLASAHTLDNKTLEEEKCKDIGCCWDNNDNATTQCYSKGFEFSQVISGSILVASIGYLEHIAIGQSFAVKGSYQVDNSQELIALGMGNVVGAFFQSYPVTGSFSRTALNFMTGVKTPLGGLFTSAIVMTGLSFLSSYFQYVPDSCLAAVIIVAVYPMIDFRKPWYFWTVSKKEFLVWSVCFVLILAFTIEIGIIAAIAVEIAMLMGRNMWPIIKIQHLQDGTYLFKIDGALWYLGAFTVKEKLSAMINGTYNKDNPNAGPKVTAIVIDFTTVSFADTTGLDKITEAVVLAAKKDLRVVGYGMLDRIKKSAAQQGLLKVMAIENSRADALQSLEYVTDSSSHPGGITIESSNLVTNEIRVRGSGSNSYQPLSHASTPEAD